LNNPLPTSPEKNTLTGSIGCLQNYANWLYLLCGIARCEEIFALLIPIGWKKRRGK